MPTKKLIAIITAMTMIAAGTAGMAKDRYAKLLFLETLISRKDCGGMREFIRTNPDMTAGNDPLAVELRSYANRLDSGLIECFSEEAAAGIQEQEINQSQQNVSSREIY